ARVSGCEETSAEGDDGQHEQNGQRDDEDTRDLCSGPRHGTPPSAGRANVGNISHRPPPWLGTAGRSGRSRSWSSTSPSKSPRGSATSTRSITLPDGSGWTGHYSPPPTTPPTTGSSSARA